MSTRPTPWLALIASLPLLAVLGCGRATDPPAAQAGGFSADTFTRQGLISGATATEAACRALPDGLWVSAGDRHECLRYGAGGIPATPGAAPTALVYFPGDPGGAAYRFAGRTAGLVRVGRLPNCRRKPVMPGRMP